MSLRWHTQKGQYHQMSNSILYTFSPFSECLLSLFFPIQIDHCTNPSGLGFQLTRSLVYPFCHCIHKPLSSMRSSFIITVGIKKNLVRTFLWNLHLLLRFYWISFWTYQAYNSTLTSVISASKHEPKYRMKKRMRILDLYSVYLLNLFPKALIK